MASEFEMWGLARPGDIQLLVPAPEQRRLIKGVSYTVCSGPLPAKSFARVMGRVFVTCPELTFVLMARHLSLVELLEIGYEMCGTYRMIDGMPTYGLAPLTSAASIRAYANRASGVHGRKAALRAAQWLADGAASPAETALAIMLKLPYRHGGYGLGTFELNREIALDGTAARILGRQTIRPDIYWPAAHHPAEYDSSQHHSSREQAEYDERRRNAYAAMGMSVSVFRPRHLANLDLMDEMVRGIRRNIGVKQQRTPDDYGWRKGELFQETCRYWLGLRDEYGIGEEFRLRAAAWAEPEIPW